MRSKSFGERIADVLIEEGLLLPNQLDEAIAIQKSEGGRLLKILTDRQFVTEQAVQDALSGVHGAGNMSQVMRKVAEEAAQSADAVEVQANKREEIDLDRLAHDSEDAPVIKIVNLILAQAVKEKASDIHIEPFQNSLKLRYRVDGELIQAESPPKALQLAITSRIKILAGLNIAERRVPQDGRFRIRVMGKEVDLRISILPTAHGEKIVIRILDKAALTGSIDQMGMDES